MLTFPKGEKGERNPVYLVGQDGVSTRLTPIEAADQRPAPKTGTSVLYHPDEEDRKYRS
jgi:hypothetical protein